MENNKKETSNDILLSIMTKKAILNAILAIGLIILLILSELL